MVITISNYATALPPDLILQAQKNKVRECDETEKGHFETYVDEGNDSFDVSLTVKAANEITVHTCECNSKSSFCRHKAALLMHIAKDKKPKDIVKARKKESKAAILLHDADVNRLKEWVKGLISKNKDIELSFVNYFSVKEQLTPLEVAKIVNDAIKAIVSNKKTIDLTQLKKLDELWGEMLAPVTADYHANVIDENSFMNFHTMLETCIAFQYKIETGSNKISKFIEDTLFKSIVPIGDLQAEEGWDKAVGYFIKQVPNGTNDVRLHYLNHLKNIAGISSRDRQIKIIDWLAKQFEKSKPETLMSGTKYQKFVLDLIVGHNLFQKYSSLLKPIYFENEYNQKLIRLLIDNQNLNEAKKYCTEQVKSNYREEYNILYWQFLKEIYTIQKDEQALTSVLTALFPYTFNFDDYLFIYERMPDEERKKWRTKMLTRSRNSLLAGKKEPMEFFFKLADAEKNYKKMIEYIDSRTPYALILQYFEKMALVDKDQLLKSIINKSDSYGWSVKIENEKQDSLYFPEFYKLFQKYYQHDYLKKAIINSEKGSWYSRPNNLIVYIKEQLQIQKK